MKNDYNLSSVDIVGGSQVDNNNVENYIDRSGVLASVNDLNYDASSVKTGITSVSSITADGHNNNNNGDDYKRKHSSDPISVSRRPSMAKRASITLSHLRRNSRQIVISAWTSFRGVFYSFISSIFFSVTTAIVKHLTAIHPGTLACFRFLGVILFALPMVSDLGENIFGPSDLRFWVMLRGIAGATSLYLRYCALHLLPLANATVIVLSMPVFVCIFARIFLKETFGFFHLFALAVTLLGIAFTAKLNIIFGTSAEEAQKEGVDKQVELMGLAAGMGATLVGSASYIVVRKVKKLHHSIILFNFGWVAVLQTGVITYYLDGFQLPDTGLSTWMLVILAICSFYAQLLLTKALQVEEAGLVSVTRASSEVFFAFVIQIFIFQRMPDKYSVIGAVLVTSAVVLTGIRKYIVTLPLDHWCRRVFALTLR